MYTHSTFVLMEKFPLRFFKQTTTIAATVIDIMRIAASAMLPIIAMVVSSALGGVQDVLSDGMPARRRFTNQHRTRNE